MPLTDYDRVFIYSNHDKMSVPQLAKQLKRGYKSISDYMDEMGLSKKQRIISHNHPFKRANRGLEATLIHIKENSKPKLL